MSSETEDYVDDFNSFTVESAAKFMNMEANSTSSTEKVKAPTSITKNDYSTERLITGSALENGGTSLDNYMRETDLISPLKVAYDDDGMQFFPSISHTQSITYDEDFDDEDFDMLRIQVDKSFRDSPRSNKHQTKDAKNKTAKPTGSSNTAATIIRKRPIKGQQIPVPPPPKMKDDPKNYMENFKKYQHRLRLAAVVSKMNEETKLSVATMEKQLVTAFKKIDQYSKLNQILTRKLDSTSVEAEFGKYKTALQEQDEIITKLMEEKRALLRTVREQAKLLEVESKAIGPEGIVVFSDGQIKVLNEKLRKLHLQLSEYRQKYQEKSDEFDVLKN